jgi:predicted ATPase
MSEVYFLDSYPTDRLCYYYAVFYEVISWRDYLEMYFSEIEVENYKCFRHLTKLKLDKGINIIVGQNNVGKTSVLEVLETKFANIPHRNKENLRRTREGQLVRSKASFVLHITRDDLLALLRRPDDTAKFRFPLSEVPTLDDVIRKRLERGYIIPEIRQYFLTQDFIFRLARQGSQSDYGSWEVADDPYIEPSITKAVRGETEYYLEFDIDNPEDLTFGDINSAGVGSDGRHRDDFVRFIGPPLQKYIYRFRATLIPSEPCKLGRSRILLPNASNLAEVLNLFIPAQMGDFTRLVREIFPNVFQISIEQIDDEHNGRVKIWNQEGALKDKELGFTLDQCGTGIGQVLAILYVVIGEDPKVILIDEPQSFLHPNAARKLIEIIKFYGKQHQIVIATHSPVIIAASSPSTVNLIVQNGAESTFVNSDIQNFKDLQSILSELGGRFSDVFGYDRVIWVEGSTEEKCFPLIVERSQPLLGTAILRVQNTGDTDQKDRDLVERIVSIYERLSSANNGLVPTTIDFIFDKENRLPEKLRQLEKLGFNIQKRQCVHFTSRRLYENYLLNPKAIQEVINEIDTDRTAGLSLKEVKDWINENKYVCKYFKDKKPPQNTESWQNDIDGASFLCDLFSKLIQTPGIEYVKTIHSVRLTEWLLEHEPGNLKEVADLIQEIMEKSRP